MLSHTYQSTLVSSNPFVLQLESNPHYCASTHSSVFTLFLTLEHFAEVVWKKQLERQKHIEARKKKKNLMKAKKGTAPGGGSTDAGSVDSTHEQSGKDVIIKKEEEEQVMVPKDKKKNKDEKKRKEKVNAVVKEDVECETVVEAEVKASRKKSRSEGETSEERDARKKSRSEGETSEERAARKALKKKKREQADAE